MATNEKPDEEKAGEIQSLTEFADKENLAQRESFINSVSNLLEKKEVLIDVNESIKAVANYVAEKFTTELSSNSKVVLIFGGNSIALSEELFDKVLECIDSNNEIAEPAKLAVHKAYDSRIRLNGDQNKRLYKVPFSDLHADSVLKEGFEHDRERLNDYLNNDDFRPDSPTTFMYINEASHGGDKSSYMHKSFEKSDLELSFVSFAASTLAKEDFIGSRKLRTRDLLDDLGRITAALVARQAYFDQIGSEGMDEFFAHLTESSPDDTYAKYLEQCATVKNFHSTLYQSLSDIG